MPSLTELLFWAGLGDQVVGRTRFCIEPAGAVERVPIVGGTKNPHIERIVALHPTVVLANREENRREDIEALRAAGLDVVLTDPNTVDEAVAMIRALGRQLGFERAAEDLCSEIVDALCEPSSDRRPRVFVAVWKEPFMGLGAASYGHDLVERCGATNVLRGRNRYPELTADELAALKPDLILLPDEPYPFKNADLPVFEAIAPARIIDGKLVWWYGPRIPEAIRSLRGIFAEAAG